MLLKQCVEAVRLHFPALASDTIFFDNPGGTQVSQEVIHRLTDYLVRSNANHGGVFRTSQTSDELIRSTRLAMADFLGASRPEEIIFGHNMTTLTFALSRAMGRDILPGDEFIVTRLDHDANIAPWCQMAEERGALIHFVDFHPEDCTLDYQDLENKLSSKTRLVAVGHASNAVGTIQDVKRIAELAHACGAWCFVDSVQYAPHSKIDVREIGCDFLACSAYKFFGPHVGILYGRYELLERLKAFKVRPADNHPPYKFETGTQNHEGIAGLLGAVEYFDRLAEATPGLGSKSLIRKTESPILPGRMESLACAFQSIREYEEELCRYLLDRLQQVKGIKIFGITEKERTAERVPTVSFIVQGATPREISILLAQNDINVWSGNFYALAVTERLGLEESGGLVRVGLAHYNTFAEINRLVDVLSHRK